MKPQATWLLPIFLSWGSQPLHASARYVFHVIRQRPIKIRDQQAKLILADVQQLINRACKQAVTAARRKPSGERIPDCSVEIQFSPPIAEIRKDNPRLSHSTLSGRDVEAELGTNYPGNDWIVIIVGAMSECDDRRADGRTIVRGCSRTNGNILLVTLEGGIPNPTDGEDQYYRSWFRRQALIWAHELGHTVGLPDLKGPGESKGLMYYRNGADHTRLSVKECLTFGVAKKR